MTSCTCLAIVVIDVSVSLAPDAILTVTSEEFRAESTGVVCDVSVGGTHCLAHTITRVFEWTGSALLVLYVFVELANGGDCGECGAWDVLGGECGECDVIGGESDVIGG